MEFPPVTAECSIMELQYIQQILHHTFSPYSYIVCTIHIDVLYRENNSYKGSAEISRLFFQHNLLLLHLQPIQRFLQIHDREWSENDMYPFNRFWEYQGRRFLLPELLPVLFHALIQALQFLHISGLRCHTVHMFSCLFHFFPESLQIFLCRNFVIMLISGYAPDIHAVHNGRFCASVNL